MKEDEQNVNNLKEYLLRQFRNGHKWIAFNRYAEPLTRDDVVCFKTLQETSVYCESNFLPFKTLAAALREINSENKNSLIDKNKLRDEVAKYPIESYMQGRDLVDELLRGELQPLIYNKQINPASDIQAYYIIEHKHPGHLVYEVGHEVYIAKEFKAYEHAQKSFQEHINFNSSLADRNKSDLILIAELKGQKLQLNVEGLPEQNTGILFTTAYPLYNIDEGKKLYKIDHWEDPQSPVLKQPMLAQFNPHTSKLKFYDGNLQMVLPGASIEFMKIDFYDFERLKVANIQSHSIAEDEKHTQSNKLRSRLS